jgi:hypothetical protein
MGLDSIPSTGKKIKSYLSHGLKTHLFEMSSMEEDFTLSSDSRESRN